MEDKILMLYNMVKDYCSENKIEVECFASIEPLGRIIVFRFRKGYKACTIRLVDHEILNVVNLNGPLEYIKSGMKQLN